MSEVKSFLGEVAGQVVSGLIDSGQFGILLQNLTSFNPHIFLKTLLESNQQPFVAVTSDDTGSLLQGSQYPLERLTTDLAVATEWRNDRSLTEPIIIVSFVEEERLGSFHRFNEVRDRDLYNHICQLALDEGGVCPNEVLTTWWRVLSSDSIKRQLSVRRLAEYYIYLKRRPEELPEASREGLYLLGLLPSEKFLSGPKESADLRKTLKNNRALINRIEILSKNDLGRINKNIDRAEKNKKDYLKKILGKVLKYNRSGADEDRKVLKVEEVEQLFKSEDDTPPPSRKKVLPADQIAAEAFLNSDNEELENLWKKFESLVDDADEDQTSTELIELVNRNERAKVVILASLIRLMNISVSAEHSGGIFEFSKDVDFDTAVTEANNSEYRPFTYTGERSFQENLKNFIEDDLLKPQILKLFDTLVEKRQELAKYSISLALCPILTLSSDPTLLVTAREYINTFIKVAEGVREPYDEIARESPEGARYFCAQLMLFDTIFFKTPGAVSALLSPLHPLHLWKFVCLLEQIADQRDKLLEDQKQLLSESAIDLPHFIKALFVPEGDVSQHSRLELPESHTYVSLPCYQENNSHFVGSEGQEKLIKIIRKFLTLYPHAKNSLRLCLVDPPDLTGLLNELCIQIMKGNLAVDGLQLVIYRCLNRSLNIGEDDQPLENIANIFSSRESAGFSLQINENQLTYPDVIKNLEAEPVHLLAIFDPSSSNCTSFQSVKLDPVHPLVIPKHFHYDSHLKQVSIHPVATGGIFDTFLGLQNRLNNYQKGSHLGVSSKLSPDFPESESLLAKCTWLILGDKLFDPLSESKGHLISLEPGARRDIMVLTEHLDKFERGFDHYLRLNNFDPSGEVLSELLESSIELIGEGLLGLIYDEGVQ